MGIVASSKLAQPQHLYPPSTTPPSPSIQTAQQPDLLPTHLSPKVNSTPLPSTPPLHPTTPQDLKYPTPRPFQHHPLSPPSNPAQLQTSPHLTSHAHPCMSNAPPQANRQHYKCGNHCEGTIVCQCGNARNRILAKLLCRGYRTARVLMLPKRGRREGGGYVLNQQKVWVWGGSEDVKSGWVYVVDSTIFGRVISI